jgi:hypothetical protein
VDDSDALRAPGTIDLSVGRTRQSLPRGNQRWTSTIPTYVLEADSGRAMIPREAFKAVTLTLLLRSVFAGLQDFRSVPLQLVFNVLSIGLVIVLCDCRR